MPQTKRLGATNHGAAMDASPESVTPEAQTPPTMSSDEPSESASPAGCLVRLTWLMFGHVALVTCAAVILKRDPPLLSTISLIYWGLVLIVVAARYVDVMHLDGATADGDPATIGDLRRFTAGTVGLATLLWAAAHAL